MSVKNRTKNKGIIVTKSSLKGAKSKSPDIQPADNTGKKKGKKKQRKKKTNSVCPSLQKLFSLLVGRFHVSVLLD